MFKIPVNGDIDPRSHMGLMRAVHRTGSIMFDAIKALTDMKILKREEGINLAYVAIAYMDKAMMEKRCQVAFIMDDDYVIAVRRENEDR